MKKTIYLIFNLAFVNAAFGQVLHNGIELPT